MMGIDSFMKTHFKCYDSVCVQLFAIPWTVTHQAPQSMGFSREEYQSGLSCPSPEDLRDPGIEPASPVSPALQVNSLPLSHQRSLKCYNYIIKIS